MKLFFFKGRNRCSTDDNYQGPENKREEITEEILITSCQRRVLKGHHHNKDLGNYTELFLWFDRRTVALDWLASWRDIPPH